MIDLLGPSNQHNLRNLSRNVSKSSAFSFISLHHSMTFLQDVIIHHLDVRELFNNWRRNSRHHLTPPHNAYGYTVCSAHQTTYNQCWINANIFSKDNNRHNNQDLPITIPTNLHHSTTENPPLSQFQIRTQN